MQSQTQFSNIPNHYCFTKPVKTKKYQLSSNSSTFIYKYAYSNNCMKQFIFYSYEIEKNLLPDVPEMAKV